jgi:hypothetical protein
MSNRISSSNRVRYFRPLLECLEERNLLSNTGYIGLLNLVASDVKASISQTFALIDTTNADGGTFNKSPNDPGALIKVETDCLRLLQLTSQVTALINLFDTLVDFGEAAGLVTNGPVPAPADANNFDAQESDFQGTLKFMSQLSADVQGSMIAALLQFDSGVGTLQPLLSQTFTSSSGVTATYQDAPSTASASGPDITEAVTVRNPTNSPVMVAMEYSCSDGTEDSLPDNTTCAANSTQTFSLTESPSPAGNEADWVVKVAGLAEHTVTTTFTA